MARELGIIKLLAMAKKSLNVLGSKICTHFLSNWKFETLLIGCEKYDNSWFEPK